MLINTEGNGKVRKQIALIFSGTNGAVVYTVPAGKTCTGYFFSDPSANARVNINNVNMGLGTSGVATSCVLPAVLVSGTVLKSLSNNGFSSFIGVEE
jgi:hypothetical protein